MPTSKRLENTEGLRGTPAVGSAPLQHKRGLKGDMGGQRFAETKAAPRSDDADAAVATGVTVVTGGEAGLGGGVNTVVGGESSEGVQGGDNRSILDSDLVPLGASDIAVLATFTVATGTGGARTFAATPANAGGSCQVAVFARNTDTDEDGDLLHEVIIAADGSAQTVTVPAVTGIFAAGDTVAVYARRVTGVPRGFGRWFGTRRTVATVA